MSTPPWYLEAPADRVNLVASERLDLLDALAIGAMPLDALASSLGALMGDAEGCLSAPVLTYALDGANHYVDVGPFQFYWQHETRRADGSLLKDAGPRTQGGSYLGDGHQKARRGLVIDHDPARDSQNSRVDITGYVALIRAVLVDGAVPRDEKNFPYLWARPYLLLTDDDARKLWSEGSGQEVDATIKTRARVRVEFQMALTRPLVPVDGDGIPTQTPWACIGRVTQWLTPGGQSQPALPILSPLSALDAWEIQSFVKEPGTSAFDGDPDVVGADTAQEATEALYGLAPAFGPTASISPFFGPLPGITTQDGYQVDAEILGNKGQRSPHGLGLVQGLHLVRDRIRRLLSGQDEGDQRHPWWTVPKHGLVALSAMMDTANLNIALLQILVTQVEARLRGEIAAAVAGLATGAPLIGWANVAFNDQDDTLTLEAGQGVRLSTPLTRDSFRTKVFFEVERSRVGAVVVYPRLSDLEANYGPSGGDYDQLKGGYTAKEMGQFNWANPDNPADPFLGVNVRSEAPDHNAADGTMIPVPGSFGVLVYGRAS